MASPFPGPPPNAAFLAQSRVPEILFGTIFPASIATIFVLARFYSRAILMKNWGWDDSWILLSWLNGGIVLTVLNCVLTRYGAGRHAVLLTLSDIERQGFIGTVCRFLYTAGLFTTKVGVCALYLRLFVQLKDRVIVWLIVAYHTIFTILLFFLLAFRCSPFQANWIPTTGSCQTYKNSLYASATLNIFGDITLLVFIIPKLSTLKIGRRQRNVLIGVMGMGVLVIIAAIVRLIRTDAQLNSANNPGYDLSFASYDIVIWSSVEINTGLVCAAAPATRPLVRLLAPRLLSSGNGGNLDGTAARRSNFADGMTDASSSQPSGGTLELGSRLKCGSGRSAESQEYGSTELWDCGGLLKDETYCVVKDKRTSSDAVEGRDHEN